MHTKEKIVRIQKFQLFPVLTKIILINIILKYRYFKIDLWKTFVKKSVSKEPKRVLLYLTDKTNNFSNMKSFEFCNFKNVLLSVKKSIHFFFLLIMFYLLDCLNQNDKHVFCRKIKSFKKFTLNNIYYFTGRPRF